MDVKHELIYRVGGGGDGDIVNSIMKAGVSASSSSSLSEELLLRCVKTEPRVHSPCDPTAVTAPAGIELGHHLASGATATSGVAPSSSAGAATPNGGLFSGITASNKRPRPDDWLPSPSSGSAGHLPPLTPSPGPPGHPYTVISNGYSSPLSSGSYEPYSPNGKIGKYNVVLTLFRGGGGGGRGRFF
jgi:ecdysone receptor